MSTKAGVGMSYHHNPNVAGREAAEQALQKAGVSNRTSSSCSALWDMTSTPWCERSGRLQEVHPLQVARQRVRQTGTTLMNPTSLLWLRRSLLRSCSGTTD